MIVVGLPYLSVFLVWIVVVGVVVVEVYCWWRSGGGDGGDILCKGGSYYNCRSAILVKCLMCGKGGGEGAASVLGQGGGYTVKYNPLPEGVPKGEARGSP